MILIINITLQGFYVWVLYFMQLSYKCVGIPCKPHPALTPGLEARSLDTRRLKALKLSQNTSGIPKPLALPKSMQESTRPHLQKPCSVSEGPFMPLRNPQPFNLNPSLSYSNYEGPWASHLRRIRTTPPESSMRPPLLSRKEGVSWDSSRVLAWG